MFKLFSAQRGIELKTLWLEGRDLSYQLRQPCPPYIQLEFELQQQLCSLISEEKQLSKWLTITPKRRRSVILRIHN